MNKEYENNLFRIILVILTVIPVFSSNGQTNPDALTISLYSGIEDLNGLKRVGTEWMYRNVSFNLEFSEGTEQLPMPMLLKDGSYVIAEDKKLKPECETKTHYTSTSMGIKVYNIQ